MSTLMDIDHIDIVVADPEGMAAFFERVGFAVHRRTEHGGGSIELTFPGAAAHIILELTAPRDDTGKVRPLGLRHIAMRAADLGAAQKAFTDAGLPASGLRTIPATGRTLFNLTNPEGGTLQIVDGA